MIPLVKKQHMPDARPGVSTKILVFTLLLAAGSSLIYGQPVRNRSRPNIIFILTDDQRWDAAGYAGNEIIHTPEMNRLAADGANFINAFASTPICAASRASLLTGLYERTHRYTFQVDKIRDKHMDLSFPKIMREHGYYTGFIGKLGVNGVDTRTLFDEAEVYDRNPKFKDKRGYYYKILRGDTVHLTRYTGEKACEFIQSAQKDRPFYLSVNFSAPHAHDPAPDQYFWDPELDDFYADVKIPEPALADDRYFNAQPTAVREGFSRTRWYWRFDTPEKYQRSVKGYYRMISAVDQEIGRIRTELKKRNLDQNTVIVLMSDNGYFLGERQLADKWLLYDSAIRVPLVIYDPGVRSPVGKIPAMTLNIDIPATILDYAGIRTPGSWQGKSLVPLLTGETQTLLRDTLLFEHLWETKSIPPSEGVRTSDWKYFRYINDKSLEELYYLKGDPMETDNLASDSKYSKVLEAMRNKCDRLIQEYQDSASGLPGELSVDFPGVPGASVLQYHWKLPDKIPHQNAYQVLVASSEENIHLNIGDVWNSGQVKSDRPGFAQHNGSALVTKKSYYWKIRLWDQDNRLTEYASPVKFTARP